MLCAVELNGSTRLPCSASRLPAFWLLAGAALTRWVFYFGLYERLRRRYGTRYAARHPAFYWVSHEAFTWLIICFTIFAPVIAARLSDRIARELFLWADAVGLGFFSASATVLAWESGIPPLSCTLVGVITGIVGGIFRDVLLNRLPAALSDRKPYGLAAFIGCWFGIVLLSDGVAAATVILVTAASIVLIRMFTLKVNWEIRYRSPLSRRIFPGNGPISLTRILRRSNAAPKPRGS